MVTAPIPPVLNGASLRLELAAAGVSVGEFDVVAEGGELRFPGLAAADQSTVEAVVAAHAGAPTPAEVNRRTVQDRLHDDLATIDAITGTAAFSVTGTTVAEVRNSAQTALRDLQRQVKDVARIDKRLIRAELQSYEAAD